MGGPRGVSDHGGMPRLQASSSWNAWVPEPITFSVIAIHVPVGSASFLRFESSSSKKQHIQKGEKVKNWKLCIWCIWKYTMKIRSAVLHIEDGATSHCTFDTWLWVILYLIRKICYKNQCKFCPRKRNTSSPSIFLQTFSFVPGVVNWIKYTVCTSRVLLLPLPGNTGSSEVVIILNLAWPLKSPDFGAFEPFGLIGKLCSPAIIGPKHGFCSGKITLSERC